MPAKPLTVAVTGLNAIDSPGPGVPVIRALRDSLHYDVRIIGLSYEALEPGIYMRDLVDKVYQIPYPSAGSEVLMARLDYIHAREKIDVVIPNFDAELFNFIRQQGKLAERGIRTFLPTLEQFEARLKGNLPAYCQKYGVLTPQTQVVGSPTDLPGALQQFAFPVVVKGKFYEAEVAYSAAQAQSAAAKISAKWGYPILLQQFVKGEEFNVTAIGDGKGNTVGAVPMRKMFITDKGKAWAGITIEDPELMEMTDRLMAGSQWRGGLELELMKTKNGEVYLIEINPRFPAWVYLAVGAGQNHPEALVRLAMGEEVKPFQGYEVGKLFIRYSFDMICDLKDFEQISVMGER